MKLEQFRDERGVSPVVGVALLIAIAVILAAVIGAVVLGLGAGGADVPQAQLNGNYDETAGTLNISHDGGEPIPADEVVIKDESGNNVTLSSKMTAGDVENFDGSTLNLASGETVTVIWEDPNSNKEHLLEEFDP